MTITSMRLVIGLGLGLALAACGADTVTGSPTTSATTSAGSGAGGQGGAQQGGGASAEGGSGLVGLGGEGQGGFGGGAGGVGGAGGSAGGPTGVLWAGAYGDDLQTWVAHGTAIGTDIAITGFFRNTIDFGGGPLPAAAGREGYVARFDPTGSHVQSFSMTATTSSGGVMGGSLVDDGQGGFYLLGAYIGSVDLGGGPLPVVSAALGVDIFLVRFDAAGAHLWSQSFHAGVPNEAADPFWLEATPIPGGVAVALLAGGPVDLGQGPSFPAGNRDLFVGAFDAQGALQWQRQIDGSASVARGLGGRLVLGGAFSETIDLGGEITLTSAGLSDAMLLELDASTGATVWAQRFGGPAHDQVTAIGGGPSGDVVVAGRFTDSIDLGGGVLTSVGEATFVGRFDASGQHLASSASATDTEYQSVAFDAAGRFVLCGQGPDRMRLLGFDASSQPLVDHAFPVHDDDPFSHTLRCASHPSGDFILYGTFEDVLDLGLPMTFTSNGNEDIFVGMYGF